MDISTPKLMIGSVKLPKGYIFKNDGAFEKLISEVQDKTIVVKR